MKRFYLIALACLALPAFSQGFVSEETMRLQSLERILVEQNKSLQMALDRLPIGGVVVAPAAAAPAAAVEQPSSFASACSAGTIPCVAQIVASMGSGGVEIIKALAGPAANVYGARVNSRASVEIAKVNSIAAIEQGRESNATMRTALTELGATGRTPTQVNTVTDSQGVSIGGGPVTWAPVTDSNKQTNPTPRVCVPTYTTAGVINGYNCS